MYSLLSLVFSQCFVAFACQLDPRGGACLFAVNKCEVHSVHFNEAFA